MIDQTIPNKIAILQYMDETKGFNPSDQNMVLYRLRLHCFQLICLLKSQNFRQYLLYLALSIITFAYQFEAFYCLFLFQYAVSRLSYFLNVLS